MQDRFKFKAIVKGYYYIDTPDKCEEFEPLIFLENIDVLDIGNIGIPEEDLEIAIRKQYSDLQDIYIERMMENFRDNSNGVDTYITITPEQIYQCTGQKDKNGKLIYVGDILYNPFSNYKYVVNFGKFTLNYTKPFSVNIIGFYITYKENIKNEIDSLQMLDLNNIEVIGDVYQNPELLED